MTNKLEVVITAIRAKFNARYNKPVNLTLRAHRDAMVADSPAALTADI
jgi:hypothetical protein